MMCILSWLFRQNFVWKIILNRRFILNENYSNEFHILNSITEHNEYVKKLNEKTNNLHAEFACMNDQIISFKEQKIFSWSNSVSSRNVFLNKYDYIIIYKKIPKH
jgi:hypothetical protein